MPIVGKYIFSDDFHSVATIGEQMILPAGSIAIGKIDDLRRADPCIMRTHFLQVQWIDVRSVDIGREHMGFVTFFIVEPQSPAVEKGETLTVGTEE